MSIQVTCASCQSQFNAPDNAVGKRTKCPKCGGIIDIQAPAANADEVFEAEEVPYAPFTDDDLEIEKPVATPAATGDRRPCPMCGEMIQKDAIKCRFCGEIFDPVLKKASLKGVAPAEKQDTTTPILIFATSLIGCFAPIIAIYGTVWLMNRPYPFKYKGLAITGTVLHWFWTLMMFAGFVLGSLHKH